MNTQHQNQKKYYVAFNTSNKKAIALSPMFKNLTDAHNWQSSYQGHEKTYCIALEKF